MDNFNSSVDDGREQDGEPRRLLSSIALSLGLSAPGGGSWLHSGWAFEHWAPKHEDEIRACAEQLAEQVHGRLSTQRSPFGGLAYSIAARADKVFAMSQSRTAPVAFAALNSWGCGPVAGFSPMPSSKQTDAADRLFIEIQAYVLERDCPEPSNGDAKPSALRI